MTSSLSDEELLSLYQRADMRGFEIFYRRHQALIFNFLLARLGSRSEAEEAFQETFLRLHAAILSFDPRQNALAWTMTIARNVAFDILRKRRRAATAYDELVHSGIVVPPRADASIVARDELQRIVANLSDDERALIETRFLADESYEEIAVQRKISVPLARQKVSRLLRKLRS